MIILTILGSAKAATPVAAAVMLTFGTASLMGTTNVADTQHVEEPQHNQNYARVSASLDINEDGVITREEFNAYMQPFGERADQQVDEQIEDAIANDDTLTDDDIEELRKMHGMGTRMIASMRVTMFAQFDANNDGILSGDEIDYEDS